MLWGTKGQFWGGGLKSGFQRTMVSLGAGCQEER